MIQLEGEWISGIHGDTISSGNCEGFEITEKTGFPVVEVRTPDNIPDGEERVTFSVNTESIDTIRSLSKELKGKTTDLKVVASGELRCARNYSVRVNSNGMLIGNGYGFVGRYPALFVVQDIHVSKSDSTNPDK